MAVEHALEWIQRRRNDPPVGWLTVDRIQQAIRQIYHDMAESSALAEMVTVVLRRRVVVLDDVPVDTWVTVHHGLGSEQIIVQAYVNGQSLPLRVKVVGPDVINVLALEPPTGRVSVLIIG